VRRGSLQTVLFKQAQNQTGIQSFHPESILIHKEKIHVKSSPKT
jgi:hypothetical protein